MNTERIKPTMMCVGLGAIVRLSKLENLRLLTRFNRTRCKQTQNVVRGASDFVLCPISDTQEVDSAEGIGQIRPVSKHYFL